jgi:uncharacterized protein (DUF885 family)
MWVSVIRKVATQVDIVEDYTVLLDSSSDLVTIMPPLSFRPLIAAGCLLCLLACTDSANLAAQSAQSAQSNESQRLNQWFDERFAEEWSFSPIRKTILGINDDDYGRIDDYSEAGLDAYLAWRRAATADLQSEFDYDALDSQAKDSFDLWVYQTDRSIQASKFRSNSYLFSQMRSTHSFLPQILIAFHTVQTREDYEALITRIEGGARAISQLVKRSRAYADNGVHAPYFAYEAVITESKKLIAGYPFDTSDQPNPLWIDFEREISGLVERGIIEPDDADVLLKQTRQALLEYWQPAYESLVEWQESDRANASPVATGIGQFPNGREHYKERLASHTTTNTTADEIHAIGLREIARIHAAMDDIQAKVDFSGTRKEFFTWLRSDTNDRRLFFSNDDNGRQAYIDEATAAIENIKAQLPNYFGLLPKADLVVRRVEAFREQDGAAQHYFSSTPDGSRPGIYYAHLSDMFAMPKPELEVIAYHEGLPGHHMQVAIAKELSGIPEFRKNSSVTTFSEGWGLYAERFAKEIPGTYATPLAEFGRLNSEIWRAVRLVVDTGLHAHGWTEEQAFDFMKENASLATPAARSEIRRYIVMPGQATAYMMGMLKILELRERAENDLGDRFDIRAFHDVILDGGALPMGLLERKVDRWLANH